MQILHPVGRSPTATYIIYFSAIQATREAARRTQCNNNLKNIGLGLQNYHDTYRTLPMGAAGRRPLLGGNNGGNLGPSWYFATLPFMEQRNMYDKIMATQAPGQASNNDSFSPEFRYGDFLNPSEIRDALRTLVPDYMRCPSSPLPVMNTQTGNICMATYTGISGGTDINPQAVDEAGNPMYPNQIWGIPTSNQIYQTVTPGRDQAEPCPNDNGVWTSTGMLRPCEYTDFSMCTDGTSNTMIVGEQSDFLQDVNSQISAKYRGERSRAECSSVVVVVLGPPAVPRLKQ